MAKKKNDEQMHRQTKNKWTRNKEQLQIKKERKRKGKKNRKRRKIKGNRISS